MTAMPVPERPHLRVIDCVHNLSQCHECDEKDRTIAGMNGAVEDLAQTIRELERDLKMWRRRYTSLEGKWAKFLRDDPDHKLAERIFKFWVKETGRTAKSQFGPDRQEQILAALHLLEKTYNDDETQPARALCCAIRGAAKEGFVNDKGMRYDDLELICRNSTNLDKNLERYRRYTLARGEEPLV